MHVDFILKGELELVEGLIDRSIRDRCEAGLGPFPIDGTNRVTQQLAAAVWTRSIPRLSPDAIYPGAERPAA